jgi:soluble lytic murein transglycosylase-like protein
MVGAMQRLSRGGLCSAIAAVAKANDLPITFFANLIWQESSFRPRTISPAGALGIAQFIPETAVEYGLMNPFEPLHALFAAGKMLRRLNDRFGNLGLCRCRL